MIANCETNQATTTTTVATQVTKTLPSTTTVTSTKYVCISKSLSIGFNGLIGALTRAARRRCLFGLTSRFHGFCLWLDDDMLTKVFIKNPVTSTATLPALTTTAFVTTNQPKTAVTSVTPTSTVTVTR